MSLVASLCLLTPVTGNAQARASSCTALDYRTMWPVDTLPGWFAGGPEYIPSAARLRALLSGRYEMDLVTTEGVPSPIVTRWTFVLVPIDSTNSTGPRHTGYDPIMAGTRTDVAQPAPLDSMRRRAYRGVPDEIEVWVSRTNGTLHWRTAPHSFAGELFEVSSFDATGFSGRWEGGHDDARIMRRGDVMVTESLRGYYCARRVDGP